jgi:hypothetical protein
MCKAASGLCFVWAAIPTFSWRVTKTAKDLSREIRCLDRDSNRGTSECVLGALPLEVTSRTELPVILFGFWPRKANSRIGGPLCWSVVDMIIGCATVRGRDNDAANATRQDQHAWPDERVSSRAASSSLPQSNALLHVVTRTIHTVYG